MTRQQTIIVGLAALAALSVIAYAYTRAAAHTHDEREGVADGTSSLEGIE